MRPVDPRLLRIARSSRGFVMLCIVLGVAVAVLVIVQARLLSGVIVEVTADGLDWPSVQQSVLALAAVFAGRALLGWLGELAAYRASARAKEELRQAALAEVFAAGPYGHGARHPGETALLVTRGIDALDGYFARYLPQLVLAVIVPVAVLLTILGADLLSAVIVAVTLPLIPVFMILIGLYTRSRVDRQWRTLAMLSGHLLDLVSGLPTLQVFGRAKSQVQAIRAIGDRYRSTTMSILRVTFLSSLALELLASLSVALVAVSVGLRLAEGQIQYAAALFVLLLAPEAYLPLRLVGQHYHAAAEGLGAAQRIFELLERTSTPLEAAAPTGIAVHEASVVYGERSGLSPTTFTAHPGTVTALMGPSGGGKSTLLALLLGELAPTGGTVTAIDPAHVAYVPQHAHLVDADLDASPTIEQVLRLGAPEATDEQLREVLTRVHLDAGLLTRRVHEATTGVSAGQAQRLAVARALLRRAPVVLMDEPTAALDGQSEEPVIAAVRAEADRGAIVIVAAHRPSLLAIADQVVVVANARDTEQRVPAPLGVAKEILGAGW